MGDQIELDVIIAQIEVSGVIAAKLGAFDPDERIEPGGVFHRVAAPVVSEQKQRWIMFPRLGFVPLKRIAGRLQNIDQPGVTGLFKGHAEELDLGEQHHAGGNHSVGNRGKAAAVFHRVGNRTEKLVVKPGAGKLSPHDLVGTLVAQFGAEQTMDNYDRAARRTFIMGEFGEYTEIQRVPEGLLRVVTADRHHLLTAGEDTQ